MNKHIENSYLITKISDIEFHVKNYYMANELDHCRSVKSYVKEWHAHNVLYKHHLFVSHTKDTDLNGDEPLYRLVCYSIIWLFSHKEY